MNQIQKLTQRVEELVKGRSEKPYTVTEAAIYLNVSKQQLYTLTSKNLIPYYKPGGKLIFFKKSDLDAYAFRNRQATKEEIINNMERI